MLTLLRSHFGRIGNRRCPSPSRKSKVPSPAVERLEARQLLHGRGVAGLLATPPVAPPTAHVRGADNGLGLDAARSQSQSQPRDTAFEGRGLAAKAGDAVQASSWRDCRRYWIGPRKVREPDGSYSVEGGIQIECPEREFIKISPARLRRQRTLWDETVDSGSNQGNTTRLSVGLTAPCRAGKYHLDAIFKVGNGPFISESTKSRPVSIKC